MNLKVWEKGKGRNSVRTDETPHYSMDKGCFFIVIRQFNPVDTYRDKFTLHLKTIVQLTARCGTCIRSKVPGLLGPKPFRPGTPRPGRFGPFFNPGLLGPL